MLRPAHLPADARTPVILWVGPYFNHSGPGVAGSFPNVGVDPTKSGPALDTSIFMQQARPFERGYTVVAVDLRGFGASGGCWDFGGPGEQADAKAAVEWAGSQPWSNGRVGMIGHSYPAWAGLMALASRPSALKALALSGAPVSTYDTLASNGVHYGPILYGAAPAYSVDNLQPGTINDNAAYQLAWASSLNPSCLARPLLRSLGSDPGTRFFRERDLADRIAGARVPVLYNQGFYDSRVKSDTFLRWTPRLGRRPRMWLGQWGHTSPIPEASGRDGWVAAMVAHFDRHLARRAVTITDPPVVVQEGPSGRFRGERRWPPSDTRRETLTIAPGSYLDLPGNSGEKTEPNLESPSSAAGITGIGAWTLSQPLATDTHLAGAPQLTVDAASAPRAVIVALLYDVSPGGSALLVTRGAARITSGRARFDLHPQDWRFAAGHRIGLLLTGADGEVWLPLDRTLLPVYVRGGSASIPVLLSPRTEFLDGGASPALRAKQPIRVP